jgi:hypothetical protein
MEKFLDRPARGEAPNAPGGFRAQTVNGTAQSRGPGWNRQWDWPDRPEAPRTGAWKGNRTGE